MSGGPLGSGEYLERQSPLYNVPPTSTTGMLGWLVLFILYFFWLFWGKSFVAALVILILIQQITSNTWSSQFLLFAGCSTIVTCTGREQVQLPTHPLLLSDAPRSLSFEWGFYAVSPSKAIFRARTYNLGAAPRINLMSIFKFMKAKRNPASSTRTEHHNTKLS